MRLIAFRDESGRTGLGARDGDTLIDLTAAGLPQTLDALLLQGETGMAQARVAIGQAKNRRSLHGITWLPPISNPAKAFAIGLNYIDHAKESKFDLPKHPVIFQRYPSSWVGHGQALVKPHVSVQFDYEAELVAVIGKAGRYISKDNALAHVAGYSVFNDGSIRDYQFRSNQWLWGKNFDASGGFGPEFVTADELPPEVRANFDTIRQNVDLEARLIDDLLDITRIARGKLPLELGPVPLHPCSGSTLATGLNWTATARTCCSLRR